MSTKRVPEHKIMFLIYDPETQKVVDAFTNTTRAYAKNEARRHEEYHNLPKGSVQVQEKYEESPEDEEDAPEHYMELNGRQVVDYESDFFMMDEDEFDPTTSLFTDAYFENGSKLTYLQIKKLSEKYPEVIYALAKEYLSEGNPLHEQYTNTQGA